MSNDIHIGLGATGVNQLYNSVVKISAPLYYDSTRWYTRIPVPVDSFFNVVRVFPASVWLAILVTLVFFGLVIFIVYRVYGLSAFDGEAYRNPGFTAQTGDFILLPVFSITENDAMPWFRKPSAGG